MQKTILFFLVWVLTSCLSDNSSQTINLIASPEIEKLRAADMSFLPLMESEGFNLKHNGVNQDAIITLKNAGCNAIRIRIWVNPIDATSSFNEVKLLAQRIKQQGMKVWITVHYSDTWADPGHQTKPTNWQNLTFTELKTKVGTYTSLIMNEIDSDIIQIGNKINDGLLWSEGKLSSHEVQCIDLINSAIQAFGNKYTTTKIMIHYAGISGSDWFFDKIGFLDFDYIGLSYYPFWHGKKLVELQNKISFLGTTYNKKVIIAETAYPFTLDYNDYTNNIVGQTNQLIPSFEATVAGQKSFLDALKNTINQSTHGFGFCYWGSEWVAFRRSTATNGSSFENMALWDFNNNLLPVLNVFGSEN